MAKSFIVLVPIPAATIVGKEIIAHLSNKRLKLFKRSKCKCWLKRPLPRPLISFRIAKKLLLAITSFGHYLTFRKDVLNAGFELTILLKCN